MGAPPLLLPQAGALGRRGPVGQVGGWRALPPLEGFERRVKLFDLCVQQGDPRHQLFLINCILTNCILATSVFVCSQSAAKAAVMEPGEAQFFGSAWLEDNTP